MEPIEIITIIGAVLIVGSVIGTWIYKKVTHKPTGGCSGNCAGCSHCTGCASVPHDDKKDNQKINQDD